MSAFASLALVRTAAVGVACAVACVGALAAWLDGAPAALAVLAGALLAGASVVLLAQGLAMLLDAGASGSSGGRWAVIGFVLRHAAVGSATFLALRAGLPAPWLLVGVTAWPIALAVVGFRAVAGSRSAAPAAAERT